MTKPVQRLKGFSIGLSAAGAAALMASFHQLSRGSCAGACAQCGTCGLTVIPVVLWLAASRWMNPGKIRELFRRQIAGSNRSDSTCHLSEDKTQ